MSNSNRSNPGILRDLLRVKYSRRTWWPGQAMSRARFTAIKFRYAGRFSDGALMAPSATLTEAVPRHGKIGANFNIWPSGISGGLIAAGSRVVSRRVLSPLFPCWLPRFTMSFRYNLEGSLLAPRAGTAYINVIADISRIPDRKQPFRGDVASTREEECACNHDGSNEGKNIAPTLYDVFFTVLSREPLPVTPRFHSCG